MRSHFEEHKIFYLVTIPFLMMMMTLRQCQSNERAIEAATPPAERPYTVHCFTPKGWVEYKTFRKSTMGRGGSYLFLVKRKDGSTFRSGMCQVENTKTVQGVSK